MYFFILNIFIYAFMYLLKRKIREFTHLRSIMMIVLRKREGKFEIEKVLFPLT